MRKTMKVSYDGIGYVNNRGKSKYWGVSANPNPTRSNEWRICVFNLSHDNVTYHFAESCRDKAVDEQLTARIASELYQYRFKFLPFYVDIDIDGIMYRLDKPNRLIYQLESTSVYKSLKNVTCGIKKGDLNIIGSGASVGKSMFSMSKSEQKLLNNIQNAITKNKLTDQGKSMLKKMISDLN